MTRTLLASASLLALAGCVGAPSSDSSYNPLSSRKYDAAWILVTPETMAPPDFPIVTVFDNRSVSTASYVQRPKDLASPCVIHGPAPDGPWHLTMPQWQGAWVKEKTVCQRDASGRFLPDGNSAERSKLPWALDIGGWQHVAGQIARWQPYYVAWGGPSAAQIPAGVIGEYREPADEWRWP